MSLQVNVQMCANCPFLDLFKFNNWVFFQKEFDHIQSKGREMDGEKGSTIEITDVGRGKSFRHSPKAMSRIYGIVVGSYFGIILFLPFSIPRIILCMDIVKAL